MTVRELIQELECYNPEMDVIVYAEEGADLENIMDVEHTCLSKGYDEDGVINKVCVAITTANF